MDEDLGYELHSHVSQTKTRLSSALEASRRFELVPVTLEWNATLDQLLARTGLPATSIDRLFLTGGDELTSVATGLALRAAADAGRGA